MNGMGSTGAIHLFTLAVDLMHLHVGLLTTNMKSWRLGRFSTMLECGFCIGTYFRSGFIIPGPISRTAVIFLAIPRRMTIFAFHVCYITLPFLP